MKYEWDDAKLAINLANHKVHFCLVEQFEWSSARIEPDTRKDYMEPRFIVYGLIEDRLYCLVFTPRGSHMRVTSLRKAKKREVKRYAT